MLRKTRIHLRGGETKGIGNTEEKDLEKLKGGDVTNVSTKQGHGIRSTV